MALFFKETPTSGSYKQMAVLRKKPVKFQDVNRQSVSLGIRFVSSAFIAKGLDIHIVVYPHSRNLTIKEMPSLFTWWALEQNTKTPL